MFANRLVRLNPIKVDGLRPFPGARSGVPRFLASYPHREKIRRALGSDIPGRAVYDPEGAGRRNVQAYTEGTTTRFASQAPPLEVAAHEAAHVLQHAGWSRDAGLGAERHAAAVMRAVRSGAGADLIGPAGSPVPSAARPFTTISSEGEGPESSQTGRELRVADDGLMATTQPSGHDAWAVPSLIEEANSRLDEVGSAIRLHVGWETITVPDPVSGDQVELTSLEPENTTTASAGEAMHIWADCGRAARDIMGVGAAQHTETCARYSEQSTPMWWLVQILALDLLVPSRNPPVVSEEQRTEASSPRTMRQEIFRETLGGNAEEAWQRYLDMSDSEREAFDRRTGINEYVQPGIGEAYVGHAGSDETPFNFHWAGVVMNSGHDRMTLENYTVGRGIAQNTDWQFSMYGPPSRPGQTFHEQHAEVLGPSAVTMQVERE